MKSRHALALLLGFALSSIVPSAAAASAANETPRVVDVDPRAANAVDRFFDLSIGSDYPGTLIRDDSMAQLRTASDELGFRYIRFHAIFHVRRAPLPVSPSPGTTRRGH